jgi:hypothetical protein
LPKETDKETEVWDNLAIMAKLRDLEARVKKLEKG